MPTLAAGEGREALTDLVGQLDEETLRDLDYWQSSTWAHDAAPIVDALAEAVAAGPTQELVVFLNERRATSRR